MGDRANIVIREEWPDDIGKHEAVFLYSHWGGTELPAILRSALGYGRDRWDDGTYLARIIFDRMVADQQGETTGFGISTRLTDNEYDLLVLYKQRVYLLSEEGYKQDGFTFLTNYPSLSFAEYVESPQTWESLSEIAVCV